MRFSICQDTAIGARASNQDRVGYCYSREALLLVVADGMGGHLRGDVAAELAMQTIAAEFQQAAQPRLQDPEAFLQRAFHAGHRRLHRYRVAHGLADSPRTTIVACIVQDDLAWWAHAGDSRLYLMRQGKLVSRTRDHSKVEAMLNLGVITQEETDTHPERNVVLNCLGSPSDPSVEMSSRVPLGAGDSILLCSDGFWSGVDEAAMAKALDEEPASDFLPGLVREAVRRQGPAADNTTALALQWNPDFTGSGAATASPSDLSDGAFTTTIPVGIDSDPETEPEQPAGDRVEGSIARIRKALKRFSRSVRSGRSSSGEEPG